MLLVISNLVVIDTLGDGNFLYNAVSIALYGDINQAANLRLASVFIMLEYSFYLRRFLEGIPYGQIVMDTAENYKYQREINFIALSILCDRPLISFAYNCSYPIFVHPTVKILFLYFIAQIIIVAFYRITHSTTIHSTIHTQHSGTLLLNKLYWFIVLE
jgi:hypothetical protein